MRVEVRARIATGTGSAAAARGPGSGGGGGGAAGGGRGRDRRGDRLGGGRRGAGFGGGGQCRRVAVPRGGRKEAVIVTGAAGGNEPGARAHRGAALMSAAGIWAGQSWLAANCSSRPRSAVAGWYPAALLVGADMSTSIWRVIPATRPPAARWSGPSVRLYRQVPGAGPSRADRVRWTGPALRGARTVTMTWTMAPSTRVLIRVPPHDRAVPGGGERARQCGRCGVWLRRPGRRTRLGGGRRRSRTGW